MILVLCYVRPYVLHIVGMCHIFAYYALQNMMNGANLE